MIVFHLGRVLDHDTKTLFKIKYVLKILSLTDFPCFVFQNVSDKACKILNALQTFFLIATYMWTLCEGRLNFSQILKILNVVDETNAIVFCK